MNDIKERLKSLAERLEKAFAILNLEKERTEMSKLEDLSSKIDFWDETQHNLDSSPEPDAYSRFHQWRIRSSENAILRCCTLFLTY